MAFPDMRVVITGGSGFIGRPLVSCLVERGHDVLMLQRNLGSCCPRPVEVHEAALECPETYRRVLQQFAPEAACHLAWEGIPDFSPETCIKNVHMGTAFLNEVFNLPTCGKVLGAGSCWEYGNSDGACLENERGVAVNHFSWAKLALMDFGLLRASELKKMFAWLRVFFVYGPGQRMSSLIPSVFKSFESDEIIELKSPEAAQDFIYLDDVVEGFVRAIEVLRWPSGAFNLGSGKLTPVRDVVRLARSIWQGERPVAIYDAHDMRSGIVASIENSSRHFQWEPKTSINEGLIKVMQQRIAS